MFFVCCKLANIDVAIGVDLDSMASFEVLSKVSLVDLAHVVDKDSLALPLLVAIASKVYFVGRFDQPDLLEALIDDSAHIDLAFAERLILYKVVAELFLILFEQAFDAFQFSHHLESQSFMMEGI